MPVYYLVAKHMRFRFMSRRKLQTISLFMSNHFGRGPIPAAITKIRKYLSLARIMRIKIPYSLTIAASAAVIQTRGPSYIFPMQKFLLPPKWLPDPDDALSAVGLFLGDVEHTCTLHGGQHGIIDADTQVLQRGRIAWSRLATEIQATGIESVDQDRPGEYFTPEDDCTDIDDKENAASANFAAKTNKFQKPKYHQQKSSRPQRDRGGKSEKHALSDYVCQEEKCSQKLHRGMIDSLRKQGIPLSTAICRDCFRKMLKFGHIGLKNKQRRHKVDRYLKPPDGRGRLVRFIGPRPNHRPPNHPRWHRSAHT